MIKMSKRKSYWKAVGSLVLLMISLMTVESSASQQKEEIESYFSEMIESFERISKGQALQKTRLTGMDRYFVSTLKQHQSMYSLLQTNSKGVIISEVIRGKTPERNFRKISDQRWFQAVKEKRENYFGIVKIQETGRYYLFWCRPVIKKRKYFVGAMVAKIDLWDSFHEIASKSSEPFLIKLGKKSFYSNHWNNVSEFERLSLDIPGVKRITLYVPKGAPAPEQPVSQPDTQVTAAAERPKTTPQKKAVASNVTEKKNTEKDEKTSPFASPRMVKAFIFFSIFVMVVFIIVTASYISRLRQRALMRKIEEGDFVSDD